MYTEIMTNRRVGNVKNWVILRVCDFCILRCAPGSRAFFGRRQTAARYFIFVIPSEAKDLCTPL
jgi:hypothetical protein